MNTRKSEEKMFATIRQMEKTDVSGVLRIARIYHPRCLRQDVFTWMLDQGNFVGAVVGYQERILGYMVCEILLYRFRITDIAVDKEFLRRGLASGMMKYLKAGLSKQRPRVFVDVPEKRPWLAHFLIANGFRLVTTNKNYFKNPEEDGYRFYFP